MTVVVETEGAPAPSVSTETPAIESGDAVEIARIEAEAATEQTRIHADTSVAIAQINADDADLATVEDELKWLDVRLDALERRGSQLAAALETILLNQTEILNRLAALQSQSPSIQTPLLVETETTEASPEAMPQPVPAVADGPRESPGVAAVTKRARNWL